MKKKEGFRSKYQSNESVDVPYRKPQNKVSVLTLDLCIEEPLEGIEEPLEGNAFNTSEIKSLFQQQLSPQAAKEYEHTSVNSSFIDRVEDNLEHLKKLFSQSASRGD